MLRFIPVRCRRLNHLRRQSVLAVPPPKMPSNNARAENKARLGSSFQHTNSVVMRGCDRLVSLQLEQSATALGAIILDVLAEASMSKRLQTLSQAFERITFLSLTYRVTPKAASIITGGYVAGFVPDPEDSISTVESLLATQGAQSGHWWETREVRPRLERKQLFTHQGNEVRLRSPGRFVLISDGASTGSLPLSVDVEWTVELSQPSFEDHKELSVTYTLRDDIISVPGSSFLKALHGGDIITPRPEPGMVFKLSIPLAVEYAEGTGDTGTWRYWYIQWQAEGAKYGDYSNGFIIGKSWQSDLEFQMLLPAGLTLQVVSENRPLTRCPLGRPSASMPTSGKSCNAHRTSCFVSPSAQPLPLIPSQGELVRAISSLQNALISLRPFSPLSPQGEPEQSEPPREQLLQSPAPSIVESVSIIDEC